MKNLSLYLSASFLVLSLASPVRAADLQGRVDDLEATVDALRAEIADLRKQPEFTPSPNFKSSKGDYAFKIRGQIAGDVAVFDNREGPTDFNDGTQLRRARLGVDGTINTDWAYRLEIDVGNASRDDNTGQEIDVKDAYIQYKGIDKTTITVGQHKTPNTLQQAYSSSDTLFAELPLFVEAFTNRTTAGGDYKAGASAKYSDVNWTATAGIFGENYSSNGGTAPNTYRDEGWGPASRLTWAPVNGIDKTLHLGVSGYWRDTGGRTTGGNSGVRFRSTPEVSVDSTRLVDTGNIAAKSYAFEGVELAGQYGPVYVESEYGRTQVNRANASNVDFDGAYVAASYVLTGENRAYKDGTFSRIKPANPFSLKGDGTGAWEVATRYSTIDLNDGTLLGGSEDNYSAALNWYPNDYTRVMFNYVRFDAERAGVNSEGDALLSRVAVVW
ncbi:MAG: porin [Parvibaculum sp.]